MKITPDHRPQRAFTFSVVTNFETMARRPGGLPRDQALRNARIRVQRLAGPGVKSMTRLRQRRAPE